VTLRAATALLLGIAIGAAATLLVIALSGGWYEYHLLDSGENPRVMINQEGWELVYREGTIWQLRRPRVRLGR
jgi:beta-lactamase superfamily II metal-dependent hydrolase